jgi:hypothetical protein
LLSHDGKKWAIGAAALILLSIGGFYVLRRESSPDAGSSPPAVAVAPSPPVTQAPPSTPIDSDSSPSPSATPADESESATVAAGARVNGRFNRRVFPDVDSVGLAGAAVGRVQFDDLQQDTFEFGDLPPGRYSVHLTSHYMLPDLTGRRMVRSMKSPHSEHFELLEGEEKRLEIGFGDSFNISGTVLFDGQPMTDGVVALVGPGARSLYRLVSGDSQGAFSIEGVLPGEYEIVAARAGEYDYLIATTGPFREEIEVVDADVRKDLEFALPSTVVGRIITDQESRRGSILIQAVGPSRPSQRVSLGQRLADDGRFSFEGVPVGKYRLTLRLDGFNKELPEEIEVPPGGGELDLGEIAIPALRPVVGRVTNLPDLEDQSLTLMPAAPDARGASSEFSIGDGGAIRAEIVEPGDYNLGYYTDAQSYGPRIVIEDLAIPPGDGEFDLGDFEIDIGGDVRLKLVGLNPDSDGFVIVELRGELHLPTGPKSFPLGLTTMRGEKSVETFEGLPSGPVTVRVTPTRYSVERREQTVEVIPGEVVEIEIALLPGA